MRPAAPDADALRNRCEVKHLKAYCRQARLAVGGTKPVLLERVLQTLAAAGAAAARAVPS